MPDPKILRCAIYTRKSTEDGLDQEFNSLDAQRAACAAYIESQRHEGWLPVEESYDDGGFSRGNMNRAALTHLMDDVSADKVDVIVVYKVDRLTRNLSDFARIVDVLDRNEASFVSVTQAFNTTTSMGRLTLNVLLSFAQFEREVTSERIRDKIAASKARGIWMGGNVPIGYDVRARKLIVNQEQAKKVRIIFERYLSLGSATALAQQLEREGTCSPRRISRSGRESGGRPFSRGALYAILKNRIYLGEVSHKGQPYKGQHDAIIDHELFEAANELLARNRSNIFLGLNAEHPSLLSGLVCDSYGRCMLADHAAKKGKRYRYYASQKNEACREKLLRVPAGDLEAIVLAHLRKRRMPETIDENKAQGSTRESILNAVETVIVDPTSVEIRFKHADVFGEKSIKVPAQLARRGKEMKFMEPPKNSSITSRDPSLIKLVAKAHLARMVLEEATGLSITEISKAQGISSDYFRVLLRISYLAPDIVTAILEGRQPVQFNRQRLARATRLPIDWQEQREALGFN